jgi:hypothetical protein
MLDLDIKYFYVYTSEVRGKEQFFVKDLEIGKNDIMLDTTNKTIDEVLSLYW